MKPSVKYHCDHKKGGVINENSADRRNPLMAIWNRNGAVRVVESSRAEGTERLAPGDSRQRRKTRQSKVGNEGLALTALREWRPLAEQGNANAQFFLGVMYDKGRGVPQDYAEAVKWLRKAAEQGVAEAQYNLGVMYDRGLGVPQDYAEAVKWSRKAAEQGYAEAQFNLGVMHDIGLGVREDYAKAMKWFRKAAEQGNAKAQTNLGFMYVLGQSVPQDYAQAHMWFNLAASRHPPGEGRDIAVKNRDDVAKKMTPAQISEAQKLAREWKPKK